MLIIEIAALDNGAHRNQSGFEGHILPDGWAVIPEDTEVPKTFPFVILTAEEKTYYYEELVQRMGKNGEPVFDENGEPVLDTEYTMMTVTSMTAGVMPEPEPYPDPDPTEIDQLRADVDYIAVMTGVQL